MEGHRESQSLRRRDLILITVLIPMLLSAMIIGGILYGIGRLGDWRWFTWFALSPLIYMAWLILFLGICARNSYRLGSRNPKPRFVKSQPGAGRALAPPGTRTVTICMFRFAFITSLPLVRTLERAHLFRNLVWRSYSPSVHVAKTAMVWGSILDPDLTEIGEGAVIGWSAEIHAHTFTSRPDGSYAYVSAPIRIGARATIGGTAYVALGSVIGEGAVVEPKSYVAAFSTIPPGERWGGVPARCLRKRDHEQQRDEERIERSTEQSVKFDEVVLEQARRLVAFALGLKASELPQELSADSIEAWDSLGQLAIATALFDSYGVAIGNERVFQLRTLEDVANAIAALTVTPKDGGVSNPEEAPAISAEKPVPQPGAFRLPVDIEMLPLCDPAEATRALTERFMDRPAAEPLRVVIASSFTAQPLAITLKVWGRAFGLELDCEIAGFNQIATTLLAADGPFAGNATGVNVVLVGPTDRVFDSAEQASRAIGELLDAIEVSKSRQTTGAEMLVGTLPPLVSAFATLDRNEYEPLRHRWRSRLESMSGIQLFDFAAVVEGVGATAARNSEGEVLSRMPYSSELYQALGIALVRRILSTRRSPAKVIAVDCDNTRWGGVVGEVGLTGIKLGSDGTGHGFQLFQRYLKRLKERGLLLAVVSRNEESDVRAVFENHPEMVLAPDDIAAWRVNWNHKSENLAELAEELNVGLDSFVFLDDDAALRMEVAMRLPDVHVVPLPEDSARFCETLEHLWLFDGAQTTETDLKRTRMMLEESWRQQERKTAASLDGYLASLDLEVDMREPAENEWPRVAQLTQRTNQFNLSLRRRTLEEVKSLADDCSALIVKARDRFGDYGLVGACMIRKTEACKCELDTLVMSCRVLGRGVEEAFLHAIARIAAERGASTIVAPFVNGPRNQVVKDFLARSGFREVHPNNWELMIADPPSMPNPIRWVSRAHHFADSASPRP
jgi:FkbH-like protein